MQSGLFNLKLVLVYQKVHSFLKSRPGVVYKTPTLLYQRRGFYKWQLWGFTQDPKEDNTLEAWGCGLEVRTLASFVRIEGLSHVCGVTDRLAPLASTRGYYSGIPKSLTLLENLD